MLFSTIVILNKVKSKSNKSKNKNKLNTDDNVNNLKIEYKMLWYIC